MQRDANTAGIVKKRARVVNRMLKSIYKEPLETPLNYTTDIDLLVAVVLSAQTTDKGVNALTATLFNKYRSAKDYTDSPISVLENDISTVNYYRTKARHIQRAMAIINNQHNGKVPGTMPELLNLPGVGRKTANVVLGHLFGVVEGIAVDTHVVRLSNKFGLVQGTNPVMIESALMNILPKKDWWGFSYRIKAYGREISPARRGFDDPISIELIANQLL